jgi:threonine dehydrogenase-like Zn-dependent dehydrogenase
MFLSSGTESVGGVAVVRITTTAICGSDLHLYEVLTPLWRMAR